MKRHSAVGIDFGGVQWESLVSPRFDILERIVKRVSEKWFFDDLVVLVDEAGMP